RLSRRQARVVPHRPRRGAARTAQPQLRPRAPAARPSWAVSAAHSRGMPRGRALLRVPRRRDLVWGVHLLPGEGAPAGAGRGSHSEVRDPRSARRGAAARARLSTDAVSHRSAPGHRPADPVDATTPTAKEDDMTKTAQWTWLVYMAGDNNLEGAGRDDLAEMK